MKKIAEQINEKFLTYQEIEKMKESDDVPAEDEALSKLVDRITKKIEMKSTSAQATFWKQLFEAVKDTATNLPQGERMLKATLRGFLKEM